MLKVFLVNPALQCGYSFLPLFLNVLQLCQVEVYLFASIFFGKEDINCHS